jgi:hypothetical protein
MGELSAMYKCESEKARKNESVLENITYGNSLIIAAISSL